MDRQTLRRELKAVLDDDVRSIQGQRQDALKGQRATFDQARGALIKRQDHEWEKVGEAWKQLRTRSRDSASSNGSKTVDLHARKRDARLAVLSSKNDARHKYLDRRAANADLKTRGRPQQKDDNSVKKEFENSQKVEAAKPKPQPTRRATVSTPSPAPSPSGDVPRSTVQAKTVPAKDWSKTSTTTKTTGAKPAKKDWDKTGASKAPIIPPKDWSKKAERQSVKPTYDKEARGRIAEPKDWSAKPDRPREIRQAPKPSRDFDRS